MKRKRGWLNRTAICGILPLYPVIDMTVGITMLWERSAATDNTDVSAFYQKRAERFGRVRDNLIAQDHNAIARVYNALKLIDAGQFEKPVDWEELKVPSGGEYKHKYIMRMYSLNTEETETEAEFDSIDEATEETIR